MEVIVLKPKWGIYNQGDIIDLPDSTALACIKSGAVADAAEEKKQSKKPSKKEEE
jgi:hypothetical protein